MLALAALIGIQAFDFVIHFATDQVEPIRVLSNLVIVGWVLGALVGVFKNARYIAATLGIYLALNLFFLGQNGLTNAAQGDAPRVMLFVLIAATLVAGVWAKRLLMRAT